MKKLNVILLLNLMAFNGIAFAESAEPCGPPGAYVRVGDTQQDVLANCGKPTNSSETEQTVTTGETVRWYYTANVLQSTDSSPIMNITQAARYSVEFVDGKVHLIFAEDETYVQYTFCGYGQYPHGEVDRGDSMSKVVNNCGEPSFTDVVSPGTTQQIPITQYTYQFAPNTPSTQVTIQNGVVTQVQ